MASLSGSFRIGTGSASALIKSSSSIQSSIAAYQDNVARITYENSAKTDQDFAQYAQYLKSRADALNSTGRVTDAIKALKFQQDIVTAQKSNASANILRENIQIMAGNGTLTDKYNTIVDQFNRAIAIGDNALAQSLESQAYSVSQSIQYQSQQAASAARTLSSAKASSQGNVVTSLDNALKQLNTDVKNVGQIGSEKVVSAWVDANRGALQSMGVIIPQGAQPNYFDLVKGITSAQYNAYVLQAQIQQTYDPAAAQNTLAKAQNLQTGGTTIKTLAGDLTYQELAQAAQQPEMFSYDYASGKYTRTAQTGYQYFNGQVAGQYSGISTDNARNQIFYLNANQTKDMTQLGLTFSQNKSGTTGDGVRVESSANSPQWLQNVLGGHGETQVFTDKNGNLQFVGSSSDGTSKSIYTLVGMNGLSGLYENLPDGSYRLAGGDYGFNQGAAELLLNRAAQTQTQIQIAQANAKIAQQQLQLAAPKPLPQINLTPVAPSRPAPTATSYIQPTISTQSVQGSFVNPQQASSKSTNALQSAAGGLQSGGSGIKITGTTNAPIGIPL